MSALVLDAGAFIALDRGERRAWRRWMEHVSIGTALVTHAGIVAQVWRDPTRQGRLSRALGAIDVRPIDADLAKAAGHLLATTNGSDVNDAVLALLCRRDDTVVTGDVDDIARLLSARDLQSVRLLRP